MRAFVEGDGLENLKVAREGVAIEFEIGLGL